MAVGEVAGFGGEVLVVSLLCRLFFFISGVSSFASLAISGAGGLRLGLGRAYGVAYRLVRSRHIVRALGGFFY